MKCPCCQNEMLIIQAHAVKDSPGFEKRTYVVYFCESGGQWCNGLIAKHDLFDEKITFITPAHTSTTLHLNYVNDVSDEDLLKTIFTTFEWCNYKGL